MKSISCFLFLLLAAFQLIAQQTINGNIEHDGVERTYILYVPASYSPDQPVPLVFNFHGYTSNAAAQMFYGDFRSIADTAGFLIVHPMGTPDATGTTHFNAEWGTNVDDIGYSEALIDHLAEGYSIDQTRIYSTGMSNGGYMSYTLACRLSDRIAAVASVTGSMTVLQLNTPGGCTPRRPVPVMQIHGTDDAVVPFNGSNWSGAIQDVLQYWITHNNCDPEPIVINVPNINNNDFSSATHSVYTNGDNGVEVEFYRILNGGHTWPGTLFPNGVTNQDFNASEKIWEFFSKYDINGQMLTTSVSALDHQRTILKMYPNPVKNNLSLEFTNKDVRYLKLMDAQGKEIIFQPVNGIGQLDLSLQQLNNGIYFLHVLGKQNELLGVKKVIKN